MRITKVLTPPAGDDSVVMPLHRLARDIESRWHAGLFFEGERRNGDSRIFEWASSTGMITMRAVSDGAFALWYGEWLFDEPEVDAASLDERIESQLPCRHAEALLQAAQTAPPGEAQYLIAAALGLRDLPHAPLTAVLADRLRTAKADALGDVLMAAMLLADPSLRPALADARRGTEDEAQRAAIDHVEAMLSREGAA